MLYVVLFEDHAERGPGIRARHLPAHLEFLEAHADVVRAAGPLHHGDGAAAGGLWLVEAPSRERVDTLVQADPFHAAGLRRSVRVLGWTRVFADGRRQERK